MTVLETRPLWSAAEAASATGGRCDGAWEATGVSIDSRRMAQGDLFVAIRGEKFDGHAFVGDALAAGARAAVVAETSAGVPSARLLRVDDTLAALEGLGRAARARARAQVIAVTGSVGKTGVKDALGAVLAAQGETTCATGSLNNHIGVPLSLARLDRRAEFGVFELGMNHAGELTPLSAMARPHVAVITNVEKAHTAFFGSLTEIARAKAEIFAGLEPGGVAVLNRDNPYFDVLAGAAREAGARVTGFGHSADAEARLADWRIDAEGTRVQAAIGERILDYRLKLPGRHWALNSVAVLAAVDAVGADVSAAAAALGGLDPGPGRGRRHKISLPGLCFQLIDESYNANPASMTAALDVLGATEPGPSGRRIAVLGDMLELGAEAEAEHAALVASLEAAGVAQLFAVGPLMKGLLGILPREQQGGWFADADDMAPLIAASVGSGDVVLIKGSAGSRTGVIVHALLAMDAPATRAANGM